MKKNSIMVKKVLMSIATAAVFTFGFTSCSDEDELPSAAQTRAAQSGEYQYLTADEIANGQTRWGTRCRIHEGRQLNECLGETARNIFVYGLCVTLGLLLV